MENNTDKIILLYDGECPICQRYRDYVELRQKYNLQLYNAREHPELIKRLMNKGYDINAGMILIVQEQIFHKQDVLVVLASMLESKGPADYILRKIMKTPLLMKVFYPFLFRLRWLLLKWRGKDVEI